MRSDTLYIAYGSNLNLPQMAHRCPSGRVVGASEIKEYELLFRGSRSSAVATVEPLKGSSVPVLLWELKERDLQALDYYEGYPHLYHKKKLNVDLKGKQVTAMVYIMNAGHPFGSPADFYLNTILEGYHSSGFDAEFLERAVEKSIRLAQNQQEQRPERDTFSGPKCW
ncbi:gamma-glutamylcyclotransferase [Clostridium sp. W14A]|nr:gamma-glutamylcyclotransferase [Clostridium sp. W14A]